jgi:imidazolonepropionase-like amidohydrolase
MPVAPPLTDMGRRSTDVLLVATVLAVIAACRSVPSNDAAASAGGRRVIALVGGVIYSTPNAAPIADGALVIEGERIVAVGPRAGVRIPAGAVVLDVRGQTVLPGFWNSHVHFIGPKWAGIDTMPAERASDLLRSMFSRFGFVHVFDIGSFPEVTLVLRRRIQSGEVLGPNIQTTLAPFVPPNGTPRYVPQLKLPELRSAGDARDSVRARVAQGADAIKLFTVPITRSEPFPIMAPSAVKAVTEEAHRAGRLVFAHPTNRIGVEVALDGGVDILAHPVPFAGVLPDSLLDRMQRRQMALIPTLTLCEEDLGTDTVAIRRCIRASQNQVRAYAERGGRILFGTDVGYITRYDPTREYELMAGAGLDFRAILASLTTAPADESGWSRRAGRIAPGFDADVVVIDGDPTQNIRTLGQVRLTIKRGRFLYDADRP